MISEQQNCYVYIVLPGTTTFVTAGRFQLSRTRDDVPLGQFVYGKKYLSRPDAVELDPVELRLDEQQYQTIRMNGFFGVIRDAMPDYWGRKVIDNYGKKHPAEFDYLLLGADDRAGALGFGLNVEPPAPLRHFNKTIELGKLQKIASIIMNNESVAENHSDDALQVKALILQGTSMGGARPKAVVEDSSNLWLAKFSTPQDRWNQPVVEHAMLKLAKLCGLNTAKSKITPVAGKDVLLVKRFDREKCKKGYYRYRMASALTLLKADDDVASRVNWSYLLLADELRRISSNPKIDLKELFSRMCFNALISNLDDHPRNHAILANENGWRLSPAYDLTPSPVITQENRLLAMTCGIQGRNANRENLLSAHAHFFLSRDEAENIIDTMAALIKKDWYSCLRRTGANEKDCATVANAFVYEGFYQVYSQ